MQHVSFSSSQAKAFAVPSPFFAKSVFLLFMCLFFSMCAGTSHAANGPLSAITTAQKAIETSNVNLFYEAVDVDSILKKGTAAVTTVVMQKMQQGELGKVNPMLALALGSLGSQDTSKQEMVQLFIGSEVKNFISAGIGGGYFAGKPNGAVSAKAEGFTGLLKRVSKDKKELVPGKVLAQEDNAARISATLKDSDAGSFPLELGLVKTNGQWVINEILNPQALLEKTAKGK